MMQEAMEVSNGNCFATQGQFAWLPVGMSPGSTQLGVPPYLLGHMKATELAELARIMLELEEAVLAARLEATKKQIGVLNSMLAEGSKEPKGSPQQ